MPVASLKPAKIKRKYRGTWFELEECDTAVYDECVEKSKKTVEDPITGVDREEVDENLALRFLIRESVKKPDIDDWGGLGTRLTRQLERDVRELHFGLEPDEESERKKKLRKADEEDDDEGNA